MGITKTDEKNNKADKIYFKFHDKKGFKIRNAKQRNIFLRKSNTRSLI